jgi:hypothetical protein
MIINKKIIVKVVNLTRITRSRSLLILYLDDEATVTAFFLYKEDEATVTRFVLGFEG